MRSYSYRYSSSGIRTRDHGARAFQGRALLTSVQFTAATATATAAAAAASTTTTTTTTRSRVAQSVKLKRMGYGLDDGGSIRGRSKEFFSSPPRPERLWLPAVLSAEVKRWGREANHSTPCSAEVKNTCSYTSTPSYVFIELYLVTYVVCLHGLVLS
jgi:hypothetical protein